MTLLNGKIAIITGASSGIGRAAAKLFAREGAKLVVNGRRQEALNAVIAEIEAEGGQAVAISAASQPPMSWPTRCVRASPTASRNHR